ncbi:hypothetical protein BJ875DRAFT_499301 [Amylocarpus encephaloides]|uniref:Histone transcription regulator 3 homolog n=1 Tax=Amylocarpus encephaloides TaxID=45428 RepID=A0A9P7YBI0_9HELO|nr:hypothetical protein BJ875DRAFT_499301 [Amylocarpus encephaloides]
MHNTDRDLDREGWCHTRLTIDERTALFLGMMSSANPLYKPSRRSHHHLVRRTARLTAASFTALNIEPDDQVDDEVDNTKELQIEEALKLYQAALRLHSQGTQAFSQAANAYTVLFNSEIFRYPETVTEFDRIDQHPDLELIDHSFTPDGDLADVGGDAPSALPQILYLSYKNHGQFILDCVKSRSELSAEAGGDGLLDKPLIDYQARASLNYFTLALVSDQSDTELWRRTARVAATLGSASIARYCLEAAVEVDDDPTVAEVDPASLEEGFAGEQLKQRLEVLGDSTALSHPIMAPFLKKSMPAFLTKYMDPYPYLPDPTQTLGGDASQIAPREEMDARHIVTSPQRSWTAVGEALIAAFISPLGLHASGILLTVPEQERAPTIEIPEIAPSDDQIMKDVKTIGSPAVDSGEAVATPVTTKSEETPSAVDTAMTTTMTVSFSDEPTQPPIDGVASRKRSQSAAGIRDTPEEDNGTQKRSKRIRNRDNTEGSTDQATQFAEQLKPFIQADENVFEFVGGLLQHLGVEDLGTFASLQTALLNQERSNREEVVANTATRDLRDILKTWDELKASTFVNGNAADILGSSAASANAGLESFLDNSAMGPVKMISIPPFSESEHLSSFVSEVEHEWTHLQDVLYAWVLAILKTYRSTIWNEDLKRAVVRMITFADAEIVSRLREEMDHARVDKKEQDLELLEDLSQILFELHLDIYSRITNPNSIVNYETRIIAKERVNRWADIATEVVRYRERDSNDELSLRYLWASVFYATMADDVSREHKVLCWTDMQNLLQEAETPPIELQNNAVMPEISIEAAEREVSRLTTMDFFFNLFQADRSDPVAIIETLEPVLDPESACLSAESTGDKFAPSETADSTPAALREMWKFLKSGSTSLRLFLWQRLRDAYSSIGYNTKVFSCHLKSIEIIVGDLRAEDYVDSADEPRRHKLLTWLKALDDLLVKALTIALNDAATCFEIIDEKHLKSTCAAIAQLARVLHSAAIFDDEVGVGMTQLPQNTAYAPQGSFNGFLNKLREMQVRAWALQYAMIKEATIQIPDLFQNPNNDLADFLALVHYCLGLRKCCRVSNKIFLKMMKVEMIRLKHVDKWEDYLGQVLFDLYGISLGVGTYLLEDHGCPIEALDRRTVFSIADQVILLANRMPMKDLLKHDLRSTIEKMQTAVGQAKASPQMQHNLRNMTEYLKGSIRPLDMYKALKGQLDVDSLPVSTNESPLANKGWYFLLGMIALSKFRSQKRLGPGSQQDDMRVAATFMRLQLQFTAYHWETWFRLAQCFDAELEEEVLWSANKINNQRQELVKLQRSSIHCYIMALSAAARTADDTKVTAEKLSELYYEFGIRLYASSREPFRMEAFWVDEFEKHMSGSTGMYKKRLHEELSRFGLWRFAASLFRRALKDRPFSWMSHYMLGKCLWKLFSRPREEYDTANQTARPSSESVIKAFVDAIKMAPKPKDSRQEPILEPHYKLVTVVHKLVSIGALQIQAGADLLQQQQFSVNKGESVIIADASEWEAFILNSMKQLRGVDKQHWHHRMVARVANIIFDEHRPEKAQASAAYHEFRESIFTKTMHIQVWKPEAERAGRHSVYTQRYVRYICKVLFALEDKASMEQLAKRVRKKSQEYYLFTDVWNDVCTTYLRLIRKKGQIEPNMDEFFKATSPEEFDYVSDRLTEWLSSPREHPAADALRESQELKKLNANLMKSTPIDDLINDSWATLYVQVGKGLPGPDPSLQAAQMDGEGGGIPRSMGAMNLDNLVMDMNGQQIPVPVTFAGSEQSRPRKLGISRREVIRRVEAAVARMPEAPRAAPPLAARPRVAEPSMILGSNAGPDLEASATQTPENQNGDSIIQETARNSDAQDQDKESEHDEHEEDENVEDHGQDHDDEPEQHEVKSREPSVSVAGIQDFADDADDESDLSDVPDMDESEIYPQLMTGFSAMRREEEEEEDEEEEEEDGEDEANEAEEEEEEEEEGEGEEAEEEEGDEMSTAEG